MALGVRLLRLGHEPLWFDEAYTAQIAVQPVADIVAVLQTGANPPLYYLVLHSWSAWFGDSEWSLRMLSALVGTATVPLVYWVGTRLFSSRAGLIAATLAAISPLQVHYSQEVRMYCMMPPLALAVLYGMYELLVAPTTTAFVLLVAAWTAGLYVQYYFVFLLPLTLCAVLVPERRRVIPIMVAALVTVIAGFAPWWPTFVGQAGSSATDWMAVWWRSRPFWYAIPWSLESLGPGAQYPPMVNFKFPSWDIARGVSLTFATLVVGGAIRLLLESRKHCAPKPAARTRLDSTIGADGSPLPWALTLGALLMPLLIAFTLSAVRQPIYVVARYDMIAWGPYYLLAGAVLGRLSPAPRFGAIAVWIGLSSATLLPYFMNDRPRPNYASLGDVIAPLVTERAKPGDTVVFTASTRIMTQYYLRGAKPGVRLVSYPLGTDSHPGWIDVRIDTDTRFAAEAAQLLARWLLESNPLPAVIWVVAPQSNGTVQLLDELMRLGYRADQTRSTFLVLCLQRP
jgi:4-amino-4-deoxy-L-arabinose transferase-like glycosyltransferase